MPIARSEITHWLSSDVPADYGVHEVFHTINDSGFNPSVDWQNHANEIRDAFSGQMPSYTSFTTYHGRHIKVIVYDMADPKPRPEKAVATYTPTTEDNAVTYGPPQVALRCSWYAGRNLKGLRGGIYVGPLGGGESPFQKRPATGTISRVLTIGHAMFDIGGSNVSHVILHEKGLPVNPAKPGPVTRPPMSTDALTDYWCDDSWDIIRRRKLKATVRQTVHP